MRPSENRKKPHVHRPCSLGALNHPEICWRDNTVGDKQSRRFLQYPDNFLTQSVKELVRGNAQLDLVPTKNNQSGI